MQQMHLKISFIFSHYSFTYRYLTNVHYHQLILIWDINHIIWSPQQLLIEELFPMFYFLGSFFILQLKA